jgi:quercetin dioxygenase-like cupin family protein
MAIHPRGGFPVLHPVALQATQRSIGPVRASPPSAVVTQWCFESITVDEIHWPKSMSSRPGSGMVPGLETIFLAGDGKQKELFSLVFKVPPNTAIHPHSHPDERSCFVLSGLWYFAYGTVRDELKALPLGSNYTEPASTAHHGER